MNIKKNIELNGLDATIEKCKRSIGRNPEIYVSKDRINININRNHPIGNKTWGKIDFLIKNGYSVNYK